ncbi:uncharacterized protein MELLADRAFT_116860 [Melampsora larici-populina 98AG31]|uniref:N-acetylglucosaminylphosphatidylinositol deacetylase n=1 Tax=Melampsora larici-populina (strain 98AG31 / pathotype 3-4-7) TaxID=747676 RepID=F4RQT1_MELLP|nr:uncharacterized protein MELLADRAFT_116860 [Melampsora larici-populina 98AG31]EGG05093.1 hypothetical protein MELLADRAFT_116860 [Melampsora larici-populina 98AG31]
MIGRRSPPSGLHHRIQLQPQPNQQTQQTSTNQPTKPTHTPYKPIRRPTRLIHRFTKNWFIKLIILSSLISISLFYCLVISFKDWPPIGNKFTEEGFIDQFEGDWWVSPNITRSKRVLLVVAHPDDECLFFSPTLLNLLLPRYVNTTELEPGFLNSTSNSTRSSSSSGNADGLGLKRTREMRASCWAFGIISDHCIVIDHPELPDSMSVWWPEDKIAEFVKLYVELWKIDLVITFDHHGVSGHANHRAIAAAISRIVHTDPSFPMTMMLESSSLISKYTSLFSLPLSLYQHHQIRKSLLPSFQRPLLHPSRDSERLSKLVSQTLSHFNCSNHHPTIEKNLSIPSVNPNETLPDLKPVRITNHNLSNHHTIFLSTVQQYYDARRSFNQHISQNVWFRRLWCLFSKYMWINELKRVVPIEDRFEPDLKALSTPLSSSDSSNQ